MSSKITIKPFSKKYTEYFYRCFNNTINCLEGAYRAGKSVINIFSFAAYLETCEDKIHLVSGASESSARLNVSDCNGLGLSYIFRGRCKSGKYEGNECLKISTKKGEKIVIFVGGGKSDSYKKIQGLSFGSWLSVELANLYISDDEKCFIDMAMSRLTQSQNQKIWWDLNPIYPAHKVYTKYLDVYEAQQRKGEFYGGYNYMKCSLFDNAAISASQRMNIISKYPDKTSMEYQRYILGNRACAEGLIFTSFAKDPAHWIVRNRDEFMRGIHKQFISIGVDFGGNGSATTFVASLVYNGFRGIFIIASSRLDMSGENTDMKYITDEFEDFITYVRALDIAPIRAVYGDSAEQVMLATLRNCLKNMHLGNIPVYGSKKERILDRINCKKIMMESDRWFVDETAKTVIKSTQTQVWDIRPDHMDERLDNGTVDIDTADAEEYSWSAFMRRLL